MLKTNFYVVLQLGMNTLPKRGRPPVQPDQRLVLRTIRLTTAQWAKVDEFGMVWLRKLIERARPPK